MQNLSRHNAQCPAFSATPPTTQKSGLKLESKCDRVLVQPYVKTFLNFIKQYLCFSYSWMSFLTFLKIGVYSVIFTLIPIIVDLQSNAVLFYILGWFTL